MRSAVSINLGHCALRKQTTHLDLHNRSNKSSKNARVLRQSDPVISSLANTMKRLKQGIDGFDRRQYVCALRIRQDVCEAIEHSLAVVLERHGGV